VKLSVIIPALDEADRVAEAVWSAAAPGVEVIVVDGGSADATASRAAAAGARVVVVPRGRARQLAQGVCESRGDVLLFLHADTRLPPAFEEAVREALREPTTLGGAFRLRFDRHSPALRLIELAARIRASLFGLPYGDQALFVRRATLDAAGGIPQVPVMEDLDLARAIRRRGRLALLPLAVTTSARRHRAHGPLRTALRHNLAALAWALGAERGRIAAWLRR
jgi:rSAM/selenodomain-associated transferase 2